MAIKKVFVIGAGVMGNGIAQVSAQAGYDVTMSDIKDEFLVKGMASIEKSLDRGVKKGNLQESEKTEILSRIKTTIGVKDAKDADLIIEAAPEKEKESPAVEVVEDESVEDEQAMAGEVTIEEKDALKQTEEAEDKKE